MYLFIIFYDKKSDSTFWVPTAVKSQPSVFSFCHISGKAKSELLNLSHLSFPSASYLGKTRVNMLLPLKLIGFSNHASPCLHKGTLIPTPSHNHNKKPKSISFPCSLKPFSDSLGYCSALLKKPHYASNKHFYVFLACVHNQSWPLNQILCSNPSCFWRVITLFTYYFYCLLDL